MKPCPSCGWMLKDTDNACNMCGASVGGGAPAPPPMAMPAAVPAPPPMANSGAYAPPGPPGMGAYPSAPAMRAPGPVAPPPPVSSFGGAVAPPPPVSGYGQAPAPPPPIGPAAGGYGVQPPAMGGGAGFTGGGPAEVPFTPSPWARAATSAPPQAPQHMQVPAAAGGPPVAPPQPIAMVSAPGGMSGGGYDASRQPPGMPQAGYGAPPVSFAQQPGAVPAPPPMIPGGLGGRPPGVVAPPPIVSAPPMVSPGSLSSSVPQVSSGPGASGARVLVGFLVTFQNDPGGSFWPIHSGRIQMGRSAGEGIDIALHDASASSRHASIHADPATGQAFVEDDSSRNGTFLNEARLASGERRQLRDNDRLRLGSTTFVVKLLVS